MVPKLFPKFSAEYKLGLFLTERYKKKSVIAAKIPANNPLQFILFSLLFMIVSMSSAFASTTAAVPAGPAQSQEFNIVLAKLLSDPSVVYVLLMLGFYGIFFELAHPGFALPGAVGLMMLGFAFYGLQSLPVSYAGLTMLIVGMLLMLGEVFMPTFGGIGLIGVTSFVLGSLFLFDSNVSSLRVAWPVIAATTIANVGFMTFIVGLAVRARRKKVVTGREDLIGSTAIAMEDFTATGNVQLKGELWLAKTTTPILKGDSVIVTGIEGLTLSVRSEK